MIAIHNSESSDFEVWEGDKQIALLRYQWSYDRKQIQIEGLFVVPPFRREGIATFLIEQFIEEFGAYSIAYTLVNTHTRKVWIKLVSLDYTGSMGGRHVGTSIVSTR